MALTILGLSGALTHDPSVARYIDSKLVAAAEEERFVRDKHAKGRIPYEAAKFCLAQAGIKPADVNVVAIPYAPISLFEKARWHYAPERALDAIFAGNRRYYRYQKRIGWCLIQLGFDLKKVEIVPVEHHLAHAASAYHCAGFREKTAILGCPSAPGIADRINEQIKSRERRRPFCPSMIDRVGPQMQGSDHPAPFMTFTFKVAQGWKERVPEVVHEHGTSRAQVLERKHNPRYYDLMVELEKLTGNGVVLNTPLNRRGEPMICSPTDALNMFYGSDLEYLVMEGILVAKPKSAPGG